MIIIVEIVTARFLIGFELLASSFANVHWKQKSSK